MEPILPFNHNGPAGMEASEAAEEILLPWEPRPVRPGFV
jgi:hypothetical protein